MVARGRSAWLALQWVFAAAVIWYAAQLLSGQWQEVGDRLRATRLMWGYIATASVLILLTYALMIEMWRRVLRAWSASLAWPDAARIWLASNLGKYVPGKIWSIIALGALAKARGVSPLSAGASSLLMQLLSMMTGVLIAATFGATTAGAFWAAVGVAFLLIAGLVVAPMVLPRLFLLIRSLTGRELAPPPVPRRVVGAAAVATLVAWFVSGFAFRMFAHGMGLGRGPTASYVAVYAASYVAGFVALFAPGGIGVREGALVATMERAGLATAPEAAVIAVASRIWLTGLELVPGLIALAVTRRAVSGER